jgi:hypothetical protein
MHAEAALLPQQHCDTIGTERGDDAHNNFTHFSRQEATKKRSEFWATRIMTHPVIPVFLTKHLRGAAELAIYPII